MSKQFRFREYDALGLRSGRPAGDQLVSKKHVSKRKLKSENAEVTFDEKGYKEYVTGFRKRKQQRRQVAIKQLEDKERVSRNQHRTEGSSLSREAV
ncbi:hypothetical protein TSOC_000667 [Tetrabaena socialis]|uniref:Nucleolar protein 12 n=1 Tax=Tetrabaena socialis TaxID=47790 RepID=A0A2J8AIM8_9CHLO|nr:hypothetical protein TSOC_000667 [Tetrabaena socialis]|eukprot:PNH12365.1 hypothetical protein TSOC_000667 [Tetrabaena socialis]